MAKVNHEQAHLVLKLYDLRREPRLRQARAWFTGEFSPASAEDYVAKCPPGSEANANFRMVTGYWNMACGMVNRGLIDDQLFFENAGEFWFTWEKFRHIVPDLRKTFQNPIAFKQIEATALRYEKYLKRVAPNYVKFTRDRIVQMRETSRKP